MYIYISFFFDINFICNFICNHISSKISSYNIKNWKNSIYFSSIDAEKYLI